MELQNDGTFGSIILSVIIFYPNYKMLLSLQTYSVQIPCDNLSKDQEIQGLLLVLAVLRLFRLSCRIYPISPRR
jgi:hypothetical protein